ncbi:hypothetical protein PM082_002444 [Marasmius tenuissimus]|nr:hypothetical protein PM082_002444 [Marasmius tenuissimus]
MHVHVLAYTSKQFEEAGRFKWLIYGATICGKSRRPKIILDAAATRHHATVARFKGAGLVHLKVPVHLKVHSTFLDKSVSYQTRLTLVDDFKDSQVTLMIASIGRNEIFFSVVVNSVDALNRA